MTQFLSDSVKHYHVGYLRSTALTLLKLPKNREVMNALVNKLTIKN